MRLWPEVWRLAAVLDQINKTTQETRELAWQTRQVAREALATTRAVVRLLEPKLAHIAIALEDKMPLEVGKSFVATVTGLDQFGQPFPLDFSANTPQWTLSDPSLATITADPTVGSEDVTGVAAGSETLSVAFAGLSASLAFTVEAPAPVLTSLVITANPQV